VRVCCGCCLPSPEAVYQWAPERARGYLWCCLPSPGAACPPRRLCISGPESGQGAVSGAACPPGVLPALLGCRACGLEGGREVPPLPAWFVLPWPSRSPYSLLLLLHLWCWGEWLRLRALPGGKSCLQPPAGPFPWRASSVPVLLAHGSRGPTAAAGRSCG